MKNMKKLFSLVLALVMMMALVVTASAQIIDKQDPDKGSITVENAAVGVEYKFYKLFDATNQLDSNGNSISIAYTCTTKPAGLDDFFNYKEVTVNGETYFEVTPTDAAGTTGPEGKASEALVKALTTWAATAVPTYTATPEANTGEFKLNNVAYGYYVVTSKVGNGSAISVDSTVPNANIKEKNIFDKPKFPTDAKKAYNEDGDAVTSVNVGQRVDYVLRVNAMNYYTTGEGETQKQNKIFKYVIKDVVNGAYLSTRVIDSIEIHDLNADGTAGDKIADVAAPTGGFAFDNNNEITINWTKDGTENTDHLYKNGVQIVVKYHATVLESTKEGVVVNNSLSATYNGLAIEGNPSSNVTVAKITIDKYAGTAKEDGTANAPTASSKRLEGAVFLLKDSNTATAKYYKYTEASGDKSAKVEWVTSKTEATSVTTDKNGAANFYGLANGTYYLEEIEAPKGYNLMKDSQEIKVDAKAGEENAASLTATAQVANFTGTELPATGGIGTTVFTVTGAILMIGAAVLFLTKKRSEV